MTSSDNQPGKNARSDAARSSPLKSATRSHTGKKRTENQDRTAAFACPFGQVFLVADGMGGHLGGSRAAQMVAEGFQSGLEQLPSGMPIRQVLRQTSDIVNRGIYQEGSQKGGPSHGMGSTVAIALIQGGGLTVAHIGDSRVYLMRRGRLMRLTSDHNRVQKLVDSKVLSETDARKHPDSSQLTRSIGQESTVELEIAPSQELCDGDLVLVCSDGLSGEVSRRKITYIMRHVSDPEQIAEKLMAAALESGGADNISLHVIRYGTRTLSAARRAYLSFLFALSSRRGRTATALILLAVVTLAAAVFGSLRTWKEHRTARQLAAAARVSTPVPRSSPVEPKPLSLEPAKPPAAAAPTTPQPGASPGAAREARGDEVTALPAGPRTSTPGSGPPDQESNLAAVPPPPTRAAEAPKTKRGEASPVTTGNIPPTKTAEATSPAPKQESTAASELPSKQVVIVFMADPRENNPEWKAFLSWVKQIVPGLSATNAKGEPYGRYRSSVRAPVLAELSKALDKTRGISLINLNHLEPADASSLRKALRQSYEKELKRELPVAPAPSPVLEKEYGSYGFLIAVDPKLFSKAT